jgi:hypothetical protein
MRAPVALELNLRREVDALSRTISDGRVTPFQLDGLARGLRAIAADAAMYAEAERRCPGFFARDLDGPVCAIPGCLGEPVEPSDLCARCGLARIKADEARDAYAALCIEKGIRCESCRDAIATHRIVDARSMLRAVCDDCG